MTHSYSSENMVIKKYIPEYR